MTIGDDAKDLGVSRRTVLYGAALLAGGGAGVAAFPAMAQTKMSQKLAQYQRMPKGNARCNVCTQWQAPSSCKVVQGAIDPSGWCNLYAAKPNS